jgi:phospholipid/cholesterol/gamma-HCH transport system substrate-binding protein
LKNLGLEFRVGLFTIIGLVTSGFLIWFVEPERFETSKSNTYHTILKDASGIVAKTHVKTNGVNVGKVTSVKLMSDESNTRVDFEIDESVKIPVGSKLDIRTVGLLGDKFIEIVRMESAPDGFIAAGGIIPRTTTGVDMNELLSIAGAIAKDIKKITSTLADTMGHHEGQDKLANILDNFEAITENLNNILVDNRSDVRSVLSNLRESTSTLKTILSSENQERFMRIIDSFDQSMADVKGATANIKLISDRVENGEGTIGKLLSDDKTIEEIQGAIKDIREVISPATKLKIGLDIHAEARGDKNFQNFFNIQLKTRPDRFYLIGIADADYATVDTTYETVSPDPAFPAENQPRRERKSIVEEGKLRANLQIAQRWYFTQLRFGLFENKGGFAADFLALRDKLKLSIEGFDWKLTANDVRRVAHLKLYASILFFNHIYTMVGIDDPTRKDSTTGEERGAKNYFVGAGLAFDDNDLKAVFGTAALTR